jgi:hypothetical protein
LPLDPGFAGSNPSENNRFLRIVKIHSTTSFEEEVKPLVPCHSFCGMLKNPMNMKEVLHRQNSVVISHQVSPPLLLDVCAGNCQRTNQE